MMALQGAFSDGDEAAYVSNALDSDQMDQVNRLPTGIGENMGETFIRVVYV